MITEAILRWKMRRGVLELDHIFKIFLERNYSKLSENSKENIIKLLDSQDPMLLEWLLYRSSLPDNGAVKDAVMLILQDLDNNS
jgi:antitoxin CptB